MRFTLAIHPFALRATALAALVAGLAFLPWLGAAPETTMSIDNSAPLQATLLPTVSVYASVAHPERVRFEVEDRAPLEVTLLPTVHVLASVPTDPADSLAAAPQGACASCPHLVAGP